MKTIKTNIYPGTKMKNLIKLFVVLSFLVMIGCAEDTNIVSPADSMNEGVFVNKLNWIKLPAPDDASIENTYSITKLIKGKDGGKLEIRESYAGGIHGTVSIEARLIFPRGAFDGEKQITMTIDPEAGRAIFSPAGIFNKAAQYDLRLMGLDLTNINPDEVDFVYQNIDGTYEVIEKADVLVKVRDGKFQVKKAKLPHFSRFGFVN